MQALEFKTGLVWVWLLCALAFLPQMEIVIGLGSVTIGNALRDKDWHIVDAIWMLVPLRI